MGYPRMTATSDPLDDDAPRVVLPNPGRRKTAAPQIVAPPEPVEEPFDVAALTAGFRFGGTDVPAIVAEAAPLLHLAHTLRRRDTAPPIATLRRDTIAAVRDYERHLGVAGILPEQARAAHYVVCATLDDVIRSRPWGGDWAVAGLVSTFHHDVTGGDKVFELLAHFQSAPGANRDLLLLIYLCLSLGFEGRTRVSPRGALELSQIRDNLYRILRSQFGVVERDLSPHWQGQDARHSPQRRSRLFWLFTGLTALLLLLIAGGVSMQLGRAADTTLAQMATLPPDAAPSLLIPEPEPEPVIIAETPPEPVVVPEVIPVPDVPVVQPIDTFISFLQPEVEQGLVKLYRDGDAVLVRIANSGAFAQGGATINPDFIPIFDRIGQALAAEDFDATVLGHTDNLPIRSAPFPSNFHLSTARANAVRDILVTYTGPDHVDIRGEADLRPIADNTTPEGREANRRTEILVRAAGAAVSPDLLDIGMDATAGGQP
jgi:type VI secretion system protein ImpK